MLIRPLERYPHVFVPYRPEGPLRFSSVVYCECGLLETDPVHDRDAVIRYLESELKALKEQSKPAEPTKGREVVGVTVIIEGSEETHIWTMNMEHVGIDEQFYEPKILNDHYTVAAPSGIKQMVFSGRPVMDKHGISYRHVIREKHA